MAVTWNPAMRRGEHLDDEPRLMALALADPAAFAPLYERYFPRIYAYCLRRAGSPEDAEDLASLVFTRALGGLASYRGGSVAAWLFQIAHNTVANHYRSRQAAATPAPAALPTPHRAAVDANGPLAQVLRAEDRRRIVRLVSALPEAQQELLWLTVSGGLTAKEVGKIVGKSEGAVWVALHRIMKRLRAAYQREERWEER